MSLSRDFNILARATFKHPLEFEADIWDHVRQQTNCYSYALNIPDHGWARPGELLTSVDRRKPLGSSEINIENIRERLLVDGLIQVELKDVTAQTHHVIAAVIEKGDDYHFYRLLLDGHWAHKQGCGKVTMKDKDGILITDPETCNRGAYKSFVGYFAIPEEGVLYRRDPSIKAQFWHAVTSGENDTTYASVNQLSMPNSYAANEPTPAPKHNTRP